MGEKCDTEIGAPGAQGIVIEQKNYNVYSYDSIYIFSLHIRIYRGIFSIAEYSLARPPGRLEGVPGKKRLRMHFQLKSDIGPLLAWPRICLGFVHLFAVSQR